ncbi:hypothetical protein [Sulfuricaulis sp.]|jgi:hypothetical protein|uniref:hypothetical protein n=1 Tax=Sulfuricaulis sp. TaxID=2003553 RepID=UPI003559E3FF
MNSAIANLFHAVMVRTNKTLFVWMLIMLVGLPACTSVNTFPMAARAGDTVSVMVGGSELARKETMSVTLTDATSQTWDLKSLGLVRSVFNLRTEGRAYGMHYSPYLDSYISWSAGHEPVQTVLVADLPVNVNPGMATLNVSLNATDNSSGIASPFSVKLEILAGAGSSDQFLHRNAGGGSAAADFSRFEPAPHAKIDFGNGTIIGAASLTISFNNAVLNGNDINVYVPESTVRGSFISPGAFGATQRMVYWHQDGLKLYIDVVAPQGIDARYLKLFIVHPRGLSASPSFSLVSASVYDTSGAAIALQPSLTYYSY